MRRLLRIDNGHARQVFLVPQILFVLPMPIENVTDHRHPTFIQRLGVELGEPGPQPVGNAVVCPKADLSIGLHRIFPTVRFFNTDAKNASNRLAAHRGTIFLSVLAVGPRGHGSTARLLIGE